MIRASAAFALLLLASFVLGQDVPLSVEGPGVAQVKVDKVVTIKVDATVIKSFPFTVSAPSTGGLYFWSASSGVEFLDRGNVVVVNAAPKGEATLSVKTIAAEIDKDGKFLGFKTAFGSKTMAIGDVPTPDPPKPPVPPPPPVPTPAPIPTPGLRVLVLYEIVNGRPGFTQKQANEVYGEEFTKFCNERCVKDSAGNPEWRVFPKDIPLKNASELWRQAVGKYGQAVTFSQPRLVVSDGTSGYEGPLPDGGALDIVKKYAQ